MSFTQNTSGYIFDAGYFLAHEECRRITVTASASNAAVTTLANGAKYIKAGTVYPSNNGNAKGIIYEDVDVTKGDMPASLVVEGVVYEDRLPVEVASAAKTALPNIRFVAETEVTRPY